MALITGTENPDNKPGTEDADTINLLGGNDSSNGNGGNDTINGGNGLDTLSGGNGNDVLNGDADADNLNGNAGADTMNGGAGEDVFASEGLDVIDGGTGIQDTLTINVTDNAVVFNFSAFSTDANVVNTLRAGVTVRNIEFVSITAGSGNDKMSLGTYGGVLQGNLGNDTLFGSNSTDFFDQLYGGENNDTINARAGNDIYIYGGDGDDTINGGAGNDSLNGEADNDTIFGDEDNDALNGAAGNDTLDGGTGNDTLNGGIGADSFKGGDGDDVVNGSDGFDSFDGGAGTGDSMQIQVSDNSVVFDFTAFSTDPGVVNVLRPGITVRNVENISINAGAGNDKMSLGANGGVLQGNGGDDRLFGSNSVAQFDQLYGGADNDTINARGGNDIYIYGGTGNDTIYGGAGNDSLNGEEDHDLIYGETENDNLNGGAGNDTLDGGDGNDTLTGAAGADSYKGGAGDDIVNGSDGFDSFDGGTGAGDSMQIQVSDNSVVFDFTAFSTDPGVVNVLRSGVTVRNVENISINAGSGNDKMSLGTNGGVLQGNGGNDRLFGSNSVVQFDQLYGGADNDTINARGGNDIYIYGGTGNDTIYGGAGNDSLNGEEDHDLIYGETENDNLNGGAGNDTLDGGDGNDTLTGGQGVDSYKGGAGDDIVNGSDGFDSFDGGTGAGDSMQIQVSDNSVVFDFTAFSTDPGVVNVLRSGVTVRNVENISINAGSGNDKMSLGTNGGVLQGNGGNDRLFGSNSVAQFDQLYGGADNDTINARGGNDIYIYGGTGNDTIYGGAGNDSLNGEEDHDLIYGETENDNLNGGAGNDTLDGGDGNDTLTGGQGVDSYQGGAGDDIANGSDGFDSFDGGAGVGDSLSINVTDNSVVFNFGNFDVTAGVVNVLRPGITVRNVEYLSISAAGGNDRMSLGQNAGVLQGNDGADILFGSGSLTQFDQLYGGNGNDTINARAGNDIYIYGGADNDTISGGDGNDSLNGEADNDTLNGDAGNDGLNGGEGNDVLTGGAGLDTLNGGNGNDVYVDPNGDQVNEGVNQGTDTVQSTVSYSLSSLVNVENLTLLATANIDGTGNALANILQGNSGTNVLNAGDGNDTLNGGAGNDTLNAGAGSDLIVGGAGTDRLSTGSDANVDTVRYTAVSESTGPARDVIIDFDANEDRFDFTIVPTQVQTLTGGTLDEANFNAQLTTLISAAVMPVGRAVLYNPSAGTADHANAVYLIVDANGIAGYQANADYVVELQNMTGTLTSTDFI